VKAKKWDEGNLNAPSAGSLIISGNFGADVTLSGAGVLLGKYALNIVNITGAVNGRTFSVGGNVNSFSVGAFLSSSLFVGYTATNSSDPFAGGLFTPGAKLNTFKVTGVKGSLDPAFGNSLVAATTMGTVTLKSVATDNADRKFGLLLDEAIKKLIITTPSLTLTNILAAPTLPTLFVDFEVRVL
jgi:hypothetical protein